MSIAKLLAAGLGGTMTLAHADAQRFAPRSKMWVKLDDEKTRKDIIEFLQSQSRPNR